MTPLSSMRLWLSYQRYALLGAAGLLGLAAGAVMLEFPWWAWAVVVVAAALVGPLVVHVWREYPRKWRATALATRRIEAGTFAPVSLRSYCGDPCWRVVAHEILRRAATPRKQRRRMVARLRAEHDAQSHSLLIVDHTKGTLVSVEGGVTTTTSIRPPAS